MDKQVRKRKSSAKKHNQSPGFEEDKTNVSPIAKLEYYFNILIILLIIFLIVCAVGYIRSPISAVAISDLPEVKLSGSFDLNYDLTHGKRIFGFVGPECVVEDELGNLYTGLVDGRIIKIYRSSDGVIGEGKIENITDGHILDHYGSSDVVPRSRPLGIRLRDNTLFVMDAFYGLYTVDLTSKKIESLVKLTDASPAMLFFDDLDITADGNFVYFTDVSSKHTYDAVPYEILEGECTGRLFKYNLKTKKLDVVVKNLCFANGVQLTADEKIVMVAESSRYRVSLIDTTSWKIKHMVYLPATPDNIRRNNKGNYWVATTSKPTWTTFVLYRYPALRQTIVGLIPLELLFKFVNLKHNILIEIDDNGNVLGTMHDPDGEISFAVSHATDLSDGRIALGSHSAPFLTIAENKRQN